MISVTLLVRVLMQYYWEGNNSTKTLKIIFNGNSNNNSGKINEAINVERHSEAIRVEMVEIFRNFINPIFFYENTIRYSIDKFLICVN